MSDSQGATTKPTTYLPSHVLHMVVQSMNWRDKEVHVPVQPEMTWRSAIAAVSEALDQCNKDGFFITYAPRARGAQAYLKRIALEMVAASPDLLEPDRVIRRRGLPLWKAPDASSLPLPRPMTRENRLKMKEHFKLDELPDREPYELTVTAQVEDRYLAAISGRLAVHGIDAEVGDPSCNIACSDMLFDTGAHVSCITEDLLDSEFRDFLKDPINHQYRNGFRTSVQVSAVFAFGDQPALHMDCLFVVVPKDRLPNNRSGVIIGQNTVIDSIRYTSMPRRLLIAKDQPVPEGVWGDIVVDGFVDFDGKFTECPAASSA